jgi:single-stranded DNA-binding protein
MPLPTVTIFGTINKIETRFTQSGKQVTSFQIECSEKNKSGEWENLYIKTAVFEKAAEFVNNYFQDGSLCVATGKLVTEVYTGQDGAKKYDIKLKFPQIEFPPKAKHEAPQAKPMPSGDSLPQIDMDSSEIPF